ncbi:hypothetical protein RJT34_04536 [Clitoria ternatea]|uniref:Uncharacterized protein n=1 Tax=Clitoria ternatea TaxID=43366 RepID=A0AAN9KPX0_CLITE
MTIVLKTRPDRSVRPVGPGNGPDKGKTKFITLTATTLSCSFLFLHHAANSNHSLFSLSFSILNFGTL